MVEAVPPEEFVSRLVDSPHKWSRAEREFLDGLFEFPSPDLYESVVWRRHKPALADVHALGCDMQARKRAADKPHWTYEGALTAQVGPILEFRTTDTGDGFKVEHAPDEGIYHVHIGLDLGAGNENVRKRKMNLREFAKTHFKASGLEPHVCP